MPICSSDSPLFYSLVVVVNLSTVDENVTFPKEVVQPEGVRFDFLMFENDYNAVPKDGNPVEYSKKHKYAEEAGMSFNLSNQRQFGPGVNAVLKSDPSGQWYHVAFKCMKPKEAVKESR